jgi:hypothetical protein
MSALCQKQTFPASFDHLVSADEKWLRNGQAWRFRSFQIDRELKLRRLLDRKIGRILALENALDILSCLPIVLEQIEVVDDQSAEFRQIARTAIDSWHAMPRGQIDNKTDIAVYESIGVDDHAAVAADVRKRVFNLRAGVIERSASSSPAMAILARDAAIRCKSGSMLASTKKKNAVLLSTPAGSAA